MSDINTDPAAGGKGTGGAGGANSSSGGPAGGDTVSYQSYQKALDEKKAAQAKSQEYEAKIKEFEQKQLETEGKKDELITRLKTEVESSKKKTAKIAFKVLEGNVRTQAEKLGAQNADTVIKLMNLGSLKVTGDDDNFEFDNNEITSQLENLRKEQPFLFKQAGPTIKDGVPGHTITNGKEKDMKDLSLDELRATASKMSQRS